MEFILIPLSPQPIMQLLTVRPLSSLDWSHQTSLSSSC